MRLALAVVGSAWLVWSCSSSTTNVTNVTVAGDGGDDAGAREASVSDGGSADGAGADAEAPLDAALDAAPMCIGPSPVGTPSTNCTVGAACTLPGCSSGVIYACPQNGGTLGGFPSELFGQCVYSADDSKAGPRNCCPRSCVRQEGYDGECAPPATPSGYGIGYACAPGAPEPLGCKPHPDRPQGRCCAQ